jgi:integrase
MAWLEQRGNTYRIKFRHSGQHFQCAVPAADRDEAVDCLSRFKENYRLFMRGRLQPPVDADLGLFLLTDGKLNHTPVVKRSTTLGELFDHYRTHHPAGIKEANTKQMEEYHMKHLEGVLKKSTPLCDINRQKLQEYISTRSKKKSHLGTNISQTTILKEIRTLAYVWNNWGIIQGLIENQAPTKGLLFAKEQVKPPFQTWEQIERQIQNGKLSKLQISELWERLFLNTAQIKELLTWLEHKAEAFVYTAFCFAAYTGARRSELCRVQVEDLNFTTSTVHIREKKRDRSKTVTFRVIPIAKPLQVVLKHWLSLHPGGSFLFTETDQEALLPYQLTWEFRKVLAGSKWATIPGWHCFRHSFASNLAAKGVDQRLIDSFMGHQTDEMRRRYRHLFPENQEKAIELAFG